MASQQSLINRKCYLSMSIIHAKNCAKIPCCAYDVGSDVIEIRVRKRAGVTCVFMMRYRDRDRVLR